MKKKKNNKVKNLISVIAIVLLIVLCFAVVYNYVKAKCYVVKHPIVVIDVKDYGKMTLELYPEVAPNTVANFVALVNRGFYNGLTFHRTIPGFMIQGGDKEGTGAGKTNLSDLYEGGADVAYGIKGEFLANGFTNKLKHTKGVISMARSDFSQYSASLLDEGYNSAASQFFICSDDSASLDGLYASFGKLTDGWDVLEKIANAEVYYRSSELKEGEEAPKDSDGNQISSDKPKVDIVINSIIVDTHGVDYGMPETNEAFDTTDYFSKMYGGSY